MAISFPSSPTDGQVYSPGSPAPDYVFNGTLGVWDVASSIPTAIYLKKLSNLSDVSNVGVARTNLAVPGLAASNVFSNTNAFEGAVFIEEPDHLVLGSGWQTWTPTYSGGGSLTVTPGTINVAPNYLRIGPLVLFNLFVTLTMGGTAADHVIITLPSTPVATFTAATGLILNFSGEWGNSPLCYCNSSGQIFVYLPSLANWEPGHDYQVMISGFYSV